MATLKEMFDPWVQEVLKLFKFTMVPNCIIDEGKAPLNEIKTDFKVDLKCTTYKKEILDLQMELDYDIKIKEVLIINQKSNVDDRFIGVNFTRSTKRGDKNFERREKRQRF